MTSQSPVAAAVPRRRHRRRLFKWGVLARHAILILFCALAMIPVIWVFSMSFKSLSEAYSTITFFPTHPTFDAYGYAFSHIPDLPRYFLNSVIVTTCGLIGVLIVSSLGGYALVWLTFPGRKVILALMAASLFFPTQITSVIGIYQISSDLNLLDSLLGLILPYIAINLVVSTFIMTGVFRAIPKELMEAARADGCSTPRTFFQIVLPLCGNGLIVVGMLTFIAMWGEFLLAYTLTSTPNARTLTVGMAGATAGTGVWEWPRIAAVYSVMIIPPIVLFVGLQKWFMKGLMEGALRQ
jgi:ABC-type glycerol-3-phosphate transport system permease component